MSNRDDMAEQRTDWAEDRTILANERTFSSWMGSGLGAVGVAIGLKALFRSFEPTWIAKSVATLFLIGAILIFWSARNHACRTQARLNETDADSKPRATFTRLALVMSVATIGTGVILWLL